MTAIALQDVWKRRGSGRRMVHVLRGVTLGISRGEVAVLIGPSGSGKTTLLGVAAGLLSADHGAVELDGHFISHRGHAARRLIRCRNVGLVFQRPNLLSGLTASENVRLMALLAGMNAAEAAREIDRLFERLDIRCLADRRPHELSGGEEQRVGIARALIHRPAVLLADEPTANLDRDSGSAVAEILVQLAAEQGSAILIATHDLRLERYATRCLELRNGQIVAAAA